LRTGAPENLAMSKSLKHNKKGKLSPKGKRSPNRKNGKKIQTLRVPGIGFDTDAERVTLRYSDEYLLVQGASGGALTQILYGINTPRLPNRQFGAATAQGWANSAAKYTSYVCTGSKFKWRITRHNAGSAYGSLGTLGTYPTNSVIVHGVVFPESSAGQALISVNAASVQKYASKRYEWSLENEGGSTSYSALEQNPRILWSGSMAMTPSKIDGEPMLRQSKYEALITADPTAVSNYVINLQDVLADTTFKGVFLVEVQMEYDVTFFGRMSQGDSLRSGPLVAFVASTRKREPLERKEKEPARKKVSIKSTLEVD
jgi:hypothetical protein